MKLIRADGHQQQQWALANIHAQTIARILSEHLEDDATLINEIALVLQQCDGELYDNLASKLANIRAFYELNAFEEYTPIPDHVTELLQAIYDLYHQPRNGLYKQISEQINSLRGAIVELLGLELIKPRYNLEDECFNSRRFVDQQNTKITLQEVDIAALSHKRRQLEGYECKTKAQAVMHDDCIDLQYLYKAARKEDYQAHIGVISLDTSKMVTRRLKRLGSDPCIQAYGVDILSELRYSPFDEIN